MSDFKFTQLAKNTGEIKISVKGLIKNLDCSAAGRAQCKGACCKGHNEVLLPTYHSTEMEELPKHFLNKVKNDGRVKYDENGDCKLIKQCLKEPQFRPIQCKLSPLGFNKSGRLILKRWSWLRPCVCYNKGNPIYISMADCLKEVFGEEIYKKILRKIDEYNK